MTIPQSAPQFDKDVLPISDMPADPFGLNQPQWGQQQAQQPQWAQQQAQQAQAQWGQPMGMPQQQFVAVGMTKPLPAPKSKMTAALLCFFLGEFGAHNFYLGYTGRAIAQLLLFVVFCFTWWLVFGFVALGALCIWYFIEFILILAGAAGYGFDAYGRPLRS